ncbi:leucine--tRNA ligase [Sulfodiicoccus acidiphilus]|uniref:Leucine--tRNA ligase n=1 Tax=Sulfodiicoccus acidiphilus TaxID=1670455 RepID=A0A348B736_9CREN|nr:leucine--tRNA ligase [Sulfodiicoccus acidiphilus]BBD73988.1 leucine--tRNA ligase [Sulfodiicoccus acidiphilus]GGU02633.1 leucine--tRNA ligase [Sulfodiicoccus acidiphilus]
MNEVSSNFVSVLREIASKWQTVWSSGKVYDAEPDPKRPKFFLTAAFPYPNSPPHLGHARTYGTADVYARYMRMKGYNVLFPLGFHFTGTPIITMADDIARGDRELIDIFKSIYDIPPDKISMLADPLFMANYFKDEIKAALTEMGMSLDWRREFTTIDPEFSSFITWQFKKLSERGFVVKDTHPVGWCPVHNLPVGMHDTKGDVEPEIGEFTLIYFETDSGILPAATLRPETVLGVVCIWINPSEKYVSVEMDGKKFIMAEKAAQKLAFQVDDLRIVDKVDHSKLLELKAKNPLTNMFVPVIQAEFVDPLMGTGVVMSVPAHAPFDYFYIKKKGLKVTPIKVIDVPGEQVPLAVKLVDQHPPKGKEELEKLTEEVYKTEFHRGKMSPDVLQLAAPQHREELSKLVGASVKEAREMLTSFLIRKGQGRRIYEMMNRPVYCRCGNETVVKLLKDQWFLDYGNEKWKELSRELLAQMRLLPEEVRKDFQYSIEWLEKRACARTRGLGTPLPWDKRWIIESLSDSTIYMAYYTFVKTMRDAGIRATQLTPEVWDYLLLGEGDVKQVSQRSAIPEDVLSKMRNEFLYWYPLDSRHSGKDLIPNHLSFFIFNHAAIFPRELWPKQIVVNGFVLYEGKKMSKSLRNILSLRRAIRTYGADTVRLTVLGGAEIGTDSNFTDSDAKSVLEQLRWLYEFSRSITGSETVDVPERWLMSKLQLAVGDVTTAMEQLRLREVMNTLVYKLRYYVEDYLDMVKAANRGPNEKILRQFIETWIKMLFPLAPHISQEIWSSLGHRTLLDTEKWPVMESSLVDVESELSVEYIHSLIDDIKSIMNVVGGRAEEASIYVAERDKGELLRKVILELKQGKGFGELMKEMRPHDRESANLLRRVIEQASQMKVELREKVLAINLDELSVISKFSSYIAMKTGLKAVKAYEASMMKVHGVKKDSLPMKPAIMLLTKG